MVYKTKTFPCLGTQIPFAGPTGGRVLKSLPVYAGEAGDTGLTPGLGRFPDGREWLPTPVFLPGNSINRGAWRASVHGVTESDTTEQLTLSPFHFLLNYTISLGLH